MKIITIEATVYHDGVEYRAIFRNDRKGGVISEFNTMKQNICQMNANPEHVLDYFREIGADVKPLKPLAEAVKNINKGPVCAACHTNWVNVDEGEDTCRECLKRI